MIHRGSGVLLHITSLPSPYGIGDLGPSAYRFADLLAACGQKYWQILPLNPTGTFLGNSPYTSYSVFAGHPLLISPDLLVQEALLPTEEVQNLPSFPKDSVNYPAAIELKGKLLRSAYQRFKQQKHDHPQYEDFCNTNAEWLEDFTLFAALKDQFEETSWDEWPKDLRDRKEESIHKQKQKLSDRISMSKFFQYIFFKQWSSLKNYCNSKNIQIIGDVPIYPSIDSSDAWAHPELFKLNEEKRPLFVAGAPPDYFSETGQRWGNPVYRWDFLRETEYRWWMDRLEHNLKLFDLARLDHFRGFVAYWEIPADEDTAINGHWVDAPGLDFLGRVVHKYSTASLIAEDLGFITADVKGVMQKVGLPGMKVLLFAFGWDLPTNPYAPHNYPMHSVVYTGTHDNNTIRGWFRMEASEEDKARLFDYLGRTVQEEEVHWELIRLAIGSVANTAIIPMQDILGLGEEARMNLPSLSHGNWQWRFDFDQLTEDMANKLITMTRIYARS
jgi:4-alpha-glucanotransferase